MRICYADFESYWSTTHSLTKMNAIDYVMHPDTEIISLAAKFDDGETHCVFGEDKIANLLSRIDWSDVMLVGHNMSGFDAMIFAWRFGVKPKLWGCTLAMARPLFQTTVGLSLKKVAAALGVGTKGDIEATNTKGKHLKDFTPEEVAAMEEYNKLDVELCAGVFKELAPHTTRQEIQLIDATTRMLVEPEFDLDVDLLEKTLTEEQKNKELMLLDIATMTGAYVPGMEDADVADAVKKVLASAPKFAALLRDLGVEPPVKPSPTNPKKNVYALAKTDEAFLQLQDHADPIVAATARARLGVKSTLLESRITQFLAAGTALNNKMPIFLNYYAATTGRWGGCLVADTELIVYNSTHGVERKRIVDVLRDDLVWDGEAFVRHEGVVFSGYSNVICYDGVTGTEDHKVFVGEDEPLGLSEARARGVPIQTARSPEDRDVDAARIYIRHYQKFDSL